jgi:hypothetical protein
MLYNLSSIADEGYYVKNKTTCPPITASQAADGVPRACIASLTMRVIEDHRISERSQNDKCVQAVKCTLNRITG